jgi:hypothetical protein
LKYPVLLVFAAVASNASAQWIHQPTPGIARTPDGKPDLKAPAPRLADGRTDFSGIWVRITPPGYPGGPNFGNTVTFYMPEGAEVPMQPWAAQLFHRRRYEELGGGQPSERCLPHGVIGAMLPNTPFKIAHTPGVTFLLYEQFNQYRQIFTDGRTQPRDPNPAWWGYSTGHWDAGHQGVDDFVVETQGFNDRTWLDASGYPHTEAMRSIETFHRTSLGRMDLDVIVDDPKAYTRPWSVHIPLALMPDTEMIEDVCENEKDARHITGR